MRRMAGILILSLIMQLIMPMSVRAAETDMGDIISTMELEEENGQEEIGLSQKEWTVEEDGNQEGITGSEARGEEVSLEADEYNARIDVMVDSSASDINTENAIEIEGFIQEKYYRQENGYALYIGAAMPEWDAGITQLTNVAYQLDGGSMTVLGTVSSDKFAYNKPTWSDSYGGCLTLVLDSKPANAPEGEHSLTVYFTVGRINYKIAGRMELVDEFSKEERTIDKSEKTKYFSSKKGASIVNLWFECDGFSKNDKLNRLQLVRSETDDVISSVPAISSYVGYYNRSVLSYIGKDGLRYSLENNIIPKECSLTSDFNRINLTQDISEGYYDILLSASSGRTIRFKNAYYASSKPIIFSMWNSSDFWGQEKMVSDDTGNYISLYVYGLNLDQNSVPTFYDKTGSKVLAQYLKDDPMCGYELASAFGSHYRLKKMSSDLAIDKYVEGRAIVSGDVIYTGGRKYCSSDITIKGVFFEEYLKNGQLYEGSAGRVRFYIGEGVNCNVGDTVTYKLKGRYNGNTYTDTAIVQRNGNGKYIEFGENSTIYKFFPGLDSYTPLYNFIGRSLASNIDVLRHQQ